jgi:hypothetical protein
MPRPKAKDDRPRALELVDRLFTHLPDPDVHRAIWRIREGTPDGGKHILELMFDDLKELRQLVANL